jgi:hypothetical protein
VVGLLCFNTQMQQASFASTSLEAQSDNLAAREQTLHDELQALRDPQRLATAAAAAGMVVPTSACTVRLAAQTTDKGCTEALPGTSPRLDARPPKKPKVLDPPPVVVTVAPPPGTVSDTATGGHHGHRGHRANHDTARG